jgi:hypothetical protein
VAWSACGLAWLFGLGTITLAIVGRVSPRQLLEGYVVLGPLFGMPAALLGTRIVARKAGNRIGWILLGMGLAQTIAQFANIYSTITFTIHPGALPAGEFASWLYAWAWTPIVAAAPWLLLLFPDGRLPSRRWRPVAWAAAATMLLFAGGSAVTAAPIPGARLAQLAQGAAPTDAWSRWYDLFTSLLFPVTDLLALLGVVALLLRIRRSRGVARQQAKWFAYAAIPWVLVDLAAVALSPFAGALGSLIALTGLLGAIWVAVFRHRLYEIDRLLNRTLVYGLLTVTLGAAYAVAVVLLGQVFATVGGHSSLVVAGATLAVAALFQPARRRIQTAVDQRFDRRRYDAATTIGRFSARLRQEVDLETLAAELLTVVDQTMQPTKVSLWLRPSRGMSQDQSGLGASRAARQPMTASPDGSHKPVNRLRV